MRMREFRTRRFQGGGAANFAAAQLSPQQLAAMQQFTQQQQANPMAQQLAVRGAMPTPSPVAGPTSTIGTAAPGGQTPPGMGGLPAGGQMMPQAMPQGQAVPGAGGLRPGMQGGMPPGVGGQAMQQGMPGAMQRPGMGGLQGGTPQMQGPQAMNPQQAQALLAQQAAMGAGAGVGMARGGRIVPQKGMTTGKIRRSANKIVAQQGMTTGPVGSGSSRFVPHKGANIVPTKGTTGPISRTPENSFDSTKTAPGNLPTHAGGRKMRDGGEVNSFDSLKSVGGNLPLQRHSDPVRKARGGRTVLRKMPRAADRAREDRRSPSPAPYYDTARAGDDGWPPTPNFTGQPGPNVPQPVPVATPISPTPQGPPGMAEGGKWIESAIKHPGALRRQLHVPEGENIPKNKLRKAAAAPGKLGQRARMAETLGRLRKATGGECDDKVLVRPSRRAAEARREEERAEGRAHGGKVLVRPSRPAAEARREEERERGKRKGGACDKMAAGGAAKERRGFPNTIKPPKRLNLATGGTVRGAGAAERGKNFSGIY